MKKWAPEDIIILLIVLVVLGALVAGIVSSFIYPLPEKSEDNINEVITALVALISLYIGTKLGSRNKRA